MDAIVHYRIQLRQSFERGWSDPTIFRYSLGFPRYSSVFVDYGNIDLDNLGGEPVFVPRSRSVCLTSETEFIALFASNTPLFR